MADVLPAELEEKIARARVPGLIRAIASAKNRAAIARAGGKAPAATAAEEEARALRAELQQLAGAAPPAVRRDLEPENGDAAAAAEDALERLAAAGRRGAGSPNRFGGSRPGRAAAQLEDLRRELAAEDEAPPPLRWPERTEEGPAPAPPPEVAPARPPPAVVLQRSPPRRAACRGATP